MTNKVKVLVVGAAFSADLHMDGYSRCTDVAQIVGICDKNIERANDLKTRYGLADTRVFNDAVDAIEQTDCDVVDICLPNFLHHEIALAAFARNRHVICEKPLATTVEQAVEMVAAADKAGKKLYYAEDWLFAPALQRMQEIVGEGAIGQPVFYRARECHSGSHSMFAQSIAYCGGGSLIHLGIHPVGFLLTLKNNQWTELMGMKSGGGEGNFVHKRMEGEDWSACLMRFADGSTAIIEANYVTIGGMEDVVDVYGTQGCLHVDMTFSSPVSCFSVPGLRYTVEKADLTTGWSRPAVDERYNLGYVGEIRHFMESAAKGVDARQGLRGKDGLEALRVVHLIYESARKGETIRNETLD